MTLFAQIGSAFVMLCVFGSAAMLAFGVGRELRRMWRGY